MSKLPNRVARYLADLDGEPDPPPDWAEGDPVLFAMFRLSVMLEDWPDLSAHMVCIIRGWLAEHYAEGSG